MKSFDLFESGVRCPRIGERHPSNTCEEIIAKKFPYPYRSRRWLRCVQFIVISHHAPQIFDCFDRLPLLPRLLHLHGKP